MIEVDKADIAGCTWMKVPRTYQLGVMVKDGLCYKFTGFREQVLWNFFVVICFIENLCLIAVSFFHNDEIGCK